MSNKVAASMTASIIIDKKEVISSALEAYASAKKELDGNKLELLIDVSDEQALKRLKEIQQELSGKDYIIKFKNQGIDETLKSLDELYEKIKSIISGKGIGNGKGIGDSIVDEKTLKTVLDLFTNIEKHLGELRKTISDVGDGDEFSPLLKTIKEVGKSVSELSEKMSMLNPNIDFKKTDNKTNIPSPTKGVLQGDKIEQAVASAKELDKTLEKVDIPTESFNDVVSMFGIAEEKAKNILKITKQMHREGKDNRPVESYNITYKNGSNEVYGESSKPQLLRSNDVLYNVKESETKVISEQKEKYEELNRAIDRYVDVRKRIARGEALSSDEQEAKNLKEIIDELNKTDIISEEQHKNAQNKLDSLETSVKDIIALTKTSSVDKMQSEIDALNKRHRQIDSNKPIGGDRSVDYQNAINNYKESINSLQSHLDKIRKSDGAITEEEIAEWNRLSQAVEKASNNLKAFGAAEKGSTVDSRGKEIDKLTKYLAQNTRISKTARKQLKDYLDLLKNGDASINVKKIHTEWTRVAVAEREAGREGRSFFDLLKDKSIGNRAAQLVSYYLSFTDIIRYISEGIRSIRELDTAMTEMRKVSDETVSSLKEYQNASFDLANDVGTTAKQIQNSTADWMRLGEAMEDAAKSAQVSNILLNVSEFDSIDEATESLVSMSAAYKDLEKIDIVDKLNNIGNNYSIATDGLATALQKSASALVTAGNDIDEALALITAGNAVVQNPDTVGLGMQTIALRIVGTEAAKETLEELGEDTSDFIVQTSAKSQQAIKDFTKVASNNFQGFDILDDNGNFKSTYEILLGISDIYEEIVKTDKEYGSNMANGLLETLAGKRRANIAASILQNPDLLKSVYESSQDSDGSAQEELDKYLDSIDGRMQRLENQAQEFWFKLIDTDLIKDGITALTNLLSLLTDIVDLLGAPGIIGLGGLGVGVTSFIKNLD